jgi:hypothetical protein
MKINFEYKETKMILDYDNEGYLNHITNSETGKKMMVEYTQYGSGYEFTHNNGYVAMDMCHAVYVRIMELDLFIPKFIFIPNKKE